MSAPAQQATIRQYAKQLRLATIGRFSCVTMRIGGRRRSKAEVESTYLSLLQRDPATLTPNEKEWMKTHEAEVTPDNSWCCRKSWCRPGRWTATRW